MLFADDSLLAFGLRKRRWGDVGGRSFAPGNLDPLSFCLFLHESVSLHTASELDGGPRSILFIPPFKDGQNEIQRGKLLT